MSNLKWTVDGEINYLCELASQTKQYSGELKTAPVIDAQVSIYWVRSQSIVSVKEASMEYSGNNYIKSCDFPKR